MLSLNRHSELSASDHLSAHNSTSLPTDDDVPVVVDVSMAHLDAKKPPVAVDG